MCHNQSRVKQTVLRNVMVHNCLDTPNVQHCSCSVLPRPFTVTLYLEFMSFSGTAHALHISVLFRCHYLFSCSLLKKPFTNALIEEYVENGRANLPSSFQVNFYIQIPKATHHTRCKYKHTTSHYVRLCRMSTSIALLTES